MPDTPTAVAPPPAEAPSLVATVADSTTFRKAPVLRELLLYLWRNHGSAVEEYSIGIEYYDSPAGAASLVRIHIPPGEYRLDFQTVTQPNSLAPSPKPTSRWKLATLAAALVCLLLAADNLRLRTGPRAALRPEIDAFWALPSLRPDARCRSSSPRPRFGSLRATVKTPKTKRTSAGAREAEG